MVFIMHHTTYFLVLSSVPVTIKRDAYLLYVGWPSGWMSTFTHFFIWLQLLIKVLSSTAFFFLVFFIQVASFFYLPCSHNTALFTTSSRSTSCSASFIHFFWIQLMGVIQAVVVCLVVCWLVSFCVQEMSRSTSEHSVIVSDCLFREFVIVLVSAP